MSDPRPPYVRFELRETEDRDASLEAGHYVGRDVHYVLITPAGSKDCVEKQVQDWFASLREGVEQERIPGQWLTAYEDGYKRWVETQEDPEFGTPIKSWPQLSPAQLRAVQGANIRSVEELAEATEEAVLRMGMGGRALKDKAKAWLDSAKGQGKLAGELDSLRKENEALKNRDAAREQRLAELEAKLEALTETSKA